MRRRKPRRVIVAGSVGPTGELLQPLQVRGDWVQVAVLDGEYALQGQAWIRWRFEGQLAVRLVMLS